MTAGELIANAVQKSGLCNTVDPDSGEYSISRVPSDIKAFALSALNRVYEWVWRQYPHRDARIINMAVTIEEAEVVLPDEVEAIRSLRISNQALFPLNEMVIADLGGFDQLGESAVPAHYVSLSNAPVRVQPSAAGAVLLDCNSDCTVHIRGKDANGVHVAEDVSVSSGVQASSANQYSEIISISKGKTGTRLTVTVGEVEIASIAPWAERGEFRRIRIVPEPSATVTAYIDALRRFEKIVSYNDTVLLPRCENAIYCYLMAELYEFDEQAEKASSERSKAGEELVIALKFDEGIDRADFRTYPAEGMFGGCGAAASVSTMKT